MRSLGLGVLAPGAKSLNMRNVNKVIMVSCANDTAVRKGTCCLISSTKSFCTASVIGLVVKTINMWREGSMNWCHVKVSAAVPVSGKNNWVGRVCQAFFQTHHRQPNITLIGNHDTSTALVQFGEEGCRIINMKFLGKGLPDEVKEENFVSIAKQFSASHSVGMCHGNVCVDNVVLESGHLIDWDLTDKVERHPDVARAIKDDTIKKLVLKKEHDWCSLKKGVKLFAPKDKSHDVHWEFLMKNIDDETKEAKLKRASFWFF